MWNGEDEWADFEPEERAQVEGITDYSSWYDVTDPRRVFEPPNLVSFVQELWEEHGRPGLPKAAEPAERSAPGRLVLVKQGKTAPNPKIRPSPVIWCDTDPF